MHLHANHLVVALLALLARHSNAVPTAAHRALQAANPVADGDCYAGMPQTVLPNGRGVAGSITRGGENACYRLTARQGETYTITADLNGLDDSIVSVLGADGSSLGENGANALLTFFNQAPGSLDRWTNSV